MSNNGNTFGNNFKVTTFGESHGVALGCIVDGCPAGLTITPEIIQKALDRRRPGASADGKLNAQKEKRSRNYMGFANNIHYVGAINSNVKFTDDMFDENGKELKGKSYKEYKQEIIVHDLNSIEFCKQEPFV